ncbi:MAG TPA: CapA family protein [Acidimicrobiales bacterium]|nr:CapA family protein [Acidimicrobiales bacterium]
MVSRRVRRRRQQFTIGGVVLLLVIIYFAFISGGSGKPPASSSSTSTTSAHNTLADQHFPSHSPLNPDWKGSGHAVTFGFGGDVHFAGVVGEKLAQNPSTALGTTIPQLFSGAQVSMVNLETAVTDGTCPEPQNKPYIFDAPASAIPALKSASISLATEANDHGFDCGPQGLSQNLTIANQDSYPIIGIGNTAAQAFTPYRVTINGQRIAIITATQVIADNLVSTWTASATQPGVASAIDPTQLVREVQQVRKTADTVIVYVHWGTETQTCPNPQQEPLAQQLVKAGADIVVGSDAHVLSGAGYLGSSYVDYGLGNFAFYDDAPPETNSGALIITAEGRHVTSAVFRPATILSGLPQPLTGQPATTAIQSWNSARSCTNLAVTPSTSVATMSGETTPFVAPAAPPTTTTTSSPAGNTGSATTTSTTPATTTSTRASTHATTTTAAPSSTTTSATDNAGG